VSDDDKHSSLKLLESITAVKRFIYWPQLTKWAIISLVLNEHLIKRVRRESFSNKSVSFFEQKLLSLRVPITHFHSKTKLSLPRWCSVDVPLWGTSSFPESRVPILINWRRGAWRGGGGRLGCHNLAITVNKTLIERLFAHVDDDDATTTSERTLTSATATTLTTTKTTATRRTKYLLKLWFGWV
jgi:hypothetical protein